VQFEVHNPKKKKPKKWGGKGLITIIVRAIQAISLSLV
jgi:hypothetical protein